MSSIVIFLFFMTYSFDSMSQAVKIGNQVCHVNVVSETFDGLDGNLLSQPGSFSESGLEWGKVCKKIMSNYLDVIPPGSALSKTENYVVSVNNEFEGMVVSGACFLTYIKDCKDN